jgi:hypothetical protein
LLHHARPSIDGFNNASQDLGGHMSEKTERDPQIITKLLKEVLEIQKKHAFDVDISKTERQKLVLKAVEKVFQQELS